MHVILVVGITIAEPDCSDSHTFWGVALLANCRLARPRTRIAPLWWGWSVGERMHPGESDGAPVMQGDLQESHRAKKMTALSDEWTSVAPT